MPKIIRGDGPLPCPYLIIGERPGREEYMSGLPFVGPAGQELWSRIDRVLGMEREEFRVCNLLPTFSVKPPTPEEVAHWMPLLRAEIQRCRPTLIITIGYHAARALLPQFATVKGDYFHGLTYNYSYGTLHPRTALVVPVVHPSAALREPDRYQQQLTDDLRAVGRVMQALERGQVPPLHTTHQPKPYQSGLAYFAKEGLTIGLDCEGTKEEPECVAIASEMKWACCVEEPRGKRFLAAAIKQAHALVVHHLKSDWQVLEGLGIELPRRLHCTMEQAYLLGLPQSLKVLAYRLLGFEMAEYEDLVTPIDDVQVRAALRSVYEREVENQRVRREREKADKAEARAAAKAAKKAKGQGRRSHQADARRRDQRPASGRRHAAPGDAGQGRLRDAAAAEAEAAAAAGAEGLTLPTRALTTIKGLLDKDTEESVRKRWSRSKFSPHVPLPPPSTWLSAPVADRTRYVLTDAVAHLYTHQHLHPQLIRKGLEEVYRIDMGVLPMIVRMEQVGMACDARALKQLTKRFEQEYADVCTKLEAIAGHPVNPDSGEQVSDVLFKELGVTPTRRTKKSGYFTTDAKYLKARKSEHEAISLILDARQLTKFKGTYTEKLPDLLRDGRYYPDWKYTRTKTGRLAEQIILLIPKHSKRGKEIRNAFHATDGNLLVSVDLSQIEMRVMAHLSQDKVLLDIYRRGLDTHAATAHKLLGAPKRKEDQDKSLHRLPAKTLNFGIINGMSEFGMLDQLHEAGQLQWTIEEISELLREWFILHKGVRAYWDGQIKFANAKGYVVDMFGRRSPLSKIWSEDERIVRAAERETLMPIQAGADGISKIWNRKIWQYIIKPREKQGQYCEPWVRVHDDTTLEVDRRYAKDVQREMLALVPDLLSIPTTAEGERGERWGELGE